jgi:tetratricopeptide (TPR) repeat protein
VVLYATLGNLLEEQRPPRWAEAVECYAAARALRPDLGAALARALVNGGRAEEGRALYERLVAERPDNPWLHFQHGHALFDQRRYREAEAAYRDALRLQPGDPEAHNNLGVVLCDGLHEYEEAETAFRDALRLRPDYPMAHTNLGVALGNQGRYREAEAAYREALRLQPDLPLAHSDLGKALSDQSRYKEAVVACREALRLQPDLPEAHNNLGAALIHQGHYREAEAACREAIRLKPDFPLAHSNLGQVLDGQSRYPEAEAAYREAIRLKPDFFGARYCLGVVLSKQGRYKEAEAAYREAIHFRPDFPEAHYNLAGTLIHQGRFTEALAELRRGDELGSKLPGWRNPSANRVREAERLVGLDRRLVALLRGEAEPASAAERIEFAYLCGRYKRLYVPAFRLYGEAFAADPRLANDWQSWNRYNAACIAALAVVGQGGDAVRLPDKAIVMLRRQALRWLRADLALHAQLAERDDAAAKQAVRQRLAHWQQDPDLATVRDPAALAQLTDDERQAWRQLWDEVAALLRKVEGTK